VDWPGSDAALLVLVPAVALVGAGYVGLLRRAGTARDRLPSGRAA